MAVVSRTDREGPGGRALVRTFLIGDIRGYTTFTRERGDVAAARLASKFAEVAREAVEARGGEVIELRGDEALAVFGSIAQAVRAGIELQDACREETAADPDLPLPVGIGIDSGEAVPVEDGFRGRALNMAARLCAVATAGQVLVTREAAAACPDLDGIRFDDRGTVELKGFDAPVALVEAVGSPVGPTALAGPGIASGSVPEELDAGTPFVGREHELRWLLGTWRRARRGRGGLVFVSGEAGIGKTRLLAEVAARVEGNVRYVGAGGAGPARAVEELDDVGDAAAPTLLVVDDLDAMGDAVVGALSRARVDSAPVLVAGLVRDPGADPTLARIIAEGDPDGDGHRALEPFGAEDVAGVVRTYVGDDAEDAPVESMLRSSGGVPARVHEVVSDWARDEVNRRLAAAAQWLAEGRTRQGEQLRLADNVIALGLERRARTALAEPAGSETCPYQGLAAFGQEDAARFFGRERMIGELAARTVATGMVGVIG
ncbi:MAG TPA: AAA family ATPase, partial [Actinomycetota bacterium]|nr:AAA family ATPase [Actinomycetota bacterium]